MSREWALEARAALRRLRARPAFVAAAVLTVGIGVGANLGLAGFAIGLVYHERVVPEATRILWIGVVPEDALDDTPIPPPGRLVAALDGLGSWDGIAGWTGSLSNVSLPGSEPSSRWVLRATPRFFELQGVRPIAGRLLVEEEGGGVATALLGSRFARQHFGTERAAIGAQVRVDGLLREVVGVIEPSWSEGDFGLAIPLVGADTVSHLRTFVHFPTRELRDAGRSELSREVARALALAGFRTARVATGGEKEVIRGPGLPFDPAPFALSLVLLLTAAFNLAAIMLARGQEQAGNAAVRRLLGAGRWRLVRPLVVESAILAMLSTGVGLLAARGGLAAIAGRLSTDIPPALDPLPLALALGIAAAIIVLTGVWPALATQVVEARGGLRSRAASRGTEPGWLRGLHGLLTAQVVLSVPVVLSGVGLTARALAEAERGVGFAAAGLVEHSRYPEGTSEGAWNDLARVSRRLEGDGGVRSTALVQTRILTDSAGLDLGHRLLTLEPTAPPRAPRWTRVSPGALEALGVPLVEGRWPADGEAEPVALVNETAARRWFPTGGTIGGRVRLTAVDGPWLTVVGIVGDVRDQPLFQEEAPPVIYAEAPVGGAFPATLYARSNGDEASAAAAMRAALEAELSGRGHRVLSTEAEVARATAGPRLAARSAVLACVFVVLLVATGLYGLLGVIVSRRAYDLAVRVALGARPLRIATSVAAPVAWVVATGIALGSAVWWGVVRLGGLAPTATADPPAALVIVFVSTVTLIVLSAVARPLRLALGSDPAVTLRGPE